MDRIDWFPKGSSRPVCAFFDSEEAAKTAEHRLVGDGVKTWIRWFDAAVYAA